MTPVTTYLWERLLRPRLNDAGSIVWYDPARAFSAALDGPGRLTDIEVVRHAGSVTETRLALERPFAALGAGAAKPVLLYVPEARLPDGDNPFLEYELGDPLTLSLEVVAREALPGLVAPKKLDAALASGKASLQDLDNLGRSSTLDLTLLRSIYQSADALEIAMRFLSDDQHDEDVTRLNALPDLKALLENTFGQPAPAAGAGPTQVREGLWRHALLTEFVFDLPAGTPAPSGWLPKTANVEAAAQCSALLKRLRDSLPDAYCLAAAEIEAKLKRQQAFAPTADLGSTDTFQFEDRHALNAVSLLAGAGQLREARERLKAREKGFWLKRNPNVSREWATANLALRLLEQAERVTRELEDARRAGPVTPDMLAGLYVGASAGAVGGWFNLEGAQRDLESQPEREDTRLVEMARKAYAEAAYRMAEETTRAYREFGFSFSGTPTLSSTFHDLIEPLLKEGSVVFVLADALRFEMGARLVDLILSGEQLPASNVSLSARVTPLPSITPVGMAALMPHAEEGLSLDLAEGLAVSVRGEPLASASERRAYLERTLGAARVTDMTLKTLLKTRLEDLQPLAEPGVNRLVVVRSQEADKVGEAGDSLNAAGGMTPLLRDLMSAFTRLAAAGFTRFVVAADHGFLLVPTSEPDKVDKPRSAPNEKPKAGRRYWIGVPVDPNPADQRYLSLDASSVGLSLSQATPGLRLAFPRNRGVFDVGGNTTYYHGGPSLPEIITPSITFNADKPGAGQQAHVAAQSLTLTVMAVTPQGLAVSLAYHPDGGLNLGAGDPTPLEFKLDVRLGREVLATTSSANPGWVPDMGLLRLPPGGESLVMLTPVAGKGARLQEGQLVLRDPASDDILAQFPLTASAATGVKLPDRTIPARAPVPAFECGDGRSRRPPRDWPLPTDGALDVLKRVLKSGVLDQKTVKDDYGGPVMRDFTKFVGTMKGPRFITQKHVGGLAAYQVDLDLIRQAWEEAE